MGKKRDATTGTASKKKTSKQKSRPSSTSTTIPPLLLSNVLQVSSHGKNRKNPNDTCSKTLRTLIPGHVFVSCNFLGRQECLNLISWAEAGGGGSDGGDGGELISHPATRYTAQRTCHRWQQNDPIFAQQLFQRIKTSGLLEQLQKSVDVSSSSSSYGPVACNSNIRLYKYDRGMVIW